MNLEIEKQKAWEEYVKLWQIEANWERKMAYGHGFDAGVIAERKRVKKLLTDTLELDVTDYLFPDESKDE